jgi:hypothetical protein
MGGLLVRCSYRRLRLGCVFYHHFIAVSGGESHDRPAGGRQEPDVQASVGGDLLSSASPALKQRPAAAIARGAMAVAGLTMLSRMFGLVRTLVFSQTVGTSCLGSADVTASQVPNLIYELVLGGR